MMPAGGEFGVFKHYESGGNALDPQYGCESDGYPMPCEVKNALDGYVFRINQRFVYFVRAGKKSSSKGREKPTLKTGKKRSKDEVAELKSVAATGIYDNEADDIPETIDLPADLFGRASIKIRKASDFISNRVKTIGFSNEQDVAIRTRLLWMLIWKPCADAFKAAKLPTPAEQIRDYGLTIVSGNIVQSPLNDSKWSGDSQLRGKASKYIDTFTIPAFANIGAYKNRTYVIINKDIAFREGANFDEVFVHEMIHVSGGERIISYWFFGRIPYGHDLTYMGKDYDKIIDNCKIPK